MTLFKHEAKNFRQSIFSELNVWCVANFANLTYVLFKGAERPAACLFYQPDKAQTNGESEPIVTFAPFVVEQIANLPSEAGERLETWNILVRAPDWREIDRGEAAKGNRLTWKLAMWGSHRESTLLKRLENFPCFATWRKAAGLVLAAGPELRKGPGKGLTLTRELVDKQVVSFKGMRGQEAFFNIPRSCLSEPLKEENCYLRRGRGEGLDVCRPPHILINKGRRFAVFSNKFLILPPGENGIHGKNIPLLKSLALYLISPVARWHQFLVSSEWGISTSIARLDDLEALPIPLSLQDDRTISQLARLYDNLADDANQVFSKKDALLDEAEAVFWRLLKFRPHERELIEGFFAGSYQCIKGKLPDDAIDPATPADIQKYCRSLRRELDEYLQERGVRHQITVTLDDKQVCLAVEGRRTSKAIESFIHESNHGQSEVLKRIAKQLRQKHSQRVYFEKTLFFYDHGRILFFKPRRRIEWNVRQAVLDADDLIGELLSGHD
jgi:hypothetical protein